MADYRDLFKDFRTAGASVVAISVDPPAASERVRRELHLPFPILCDTERHVVKDWDLLNASERNGIARPAVFIITSTLTVQYRAVDMFAARVPATEILRMLQTPSDVKPIRRRVHMPRLGQWISGLRNMFRH